MPAEYAGSSRRAALPRHRVRIVERVAPLSAGGRAARATTLTGVTRTIERVDPADGTAMRALYDVWSAAYLEHDPDNPLPTFPEIVARATAPHRSVVEEFWSLRDGADVVGCLWLEMPTKDNLELAEVELAVHPRSQGRGHGRRLLEHLVARAAELGRHQLITGLAEPPDGDETASTRFAAAAGARRSLARSVAPWTSRRSTASGWPPCAPRPRSTPPATSSSAGPARAPTTWSTTTPRWSAG